VEDRPAGQERTFDFPGLAIIPAAQEKEPFSSADG
jgi:hypothetical protein